MVFDGAHLPEKAQTEDSRRESRELNLQKGMAFHNEGKHEAAKRCFQKCQDVTPQMAFELIEVNFHFFLERCFCFTFLLHMLIPF